MKDEDSCRHRSQCRCLAAPALLLVPPPRLAALDLGGDGGETVAWRACGVATGPGVSPGPIVVALSFDEYSSAREAPQTLAVAVMGAQCLSGREAAVVADVGGGFYAGTCRVELPLYCPNS